MPVKILLIIVVLPPYIPANEFTPPAHESLFEVLSIKREWTTRRFVLLSWLMAPPASSAVLPSNIQLTTATSVPSIPIKIAPPREGDELPLNNVLDIVTLSLVSWISIAPPSEPLLLLLLRNIQSLISTLELYQINYSCIRAILTHQGQIFYPVFHHIILILKIQIAVLRMIIGPRHKHNGVTICCCFNGITDI